MTCNNGKGCGLLCTLLWTVGYSVHTVVSKALPIYFVYLFFVNIEHLRRCRNNIRPRRQRSLWNDARYSVATQRQQSGVAYVWYIIRTISGQGHVYHYYTERRRAQNKTPASELWCGSGGGGNHRIRNLEFGFKGILVVSSSIIYTVKLNVNSAAERRGMLYYFPF